MTSTLSKTSWLSGPAAIPTREPQPLNVEPLTAKPEDPKKWLDSQLSNGKNSNQLEVRTTVEPDYSSHIASSQEIISSEKFALPQILNRARRSLNHMEVQASGFGSLHVPANLLIEIEDKRAEIEMIEDKIKNLRGEK